MGKQKNKSSATKRSTASKVSEYSTSTAAALPYLEKVRSIFCTERQAAIINSTLSV